MNYWRSRQVIKEKFDIIRSSIIHGRVGWMANIFEKPFNEMQKSKIRYTDGIALNIRNFLEICVGCTSYYKRFIL